MNKDSHKYHKDGKYVPLRSRIDYPRLEQDNQQHEEEYAAEIAPTTSDVGNDRTNDERSEIEKATEESGRLTGIVGVGFGIASLFMWSIILGPVAAIIGYYSYNQGSRTLGGWAIALGILATISYFFLIPFAR